MKQIVVANSEGKLPKSYIEKLKSIKPLQWSYVDSAFCISANLDDIEEAKFVAMKIVAALSTGLPTIYCSYISGNEVKFFHDRLRGYIEITKND